MRCSVVIPAYNAANTILGTLDSILTNLEADDEILVIDDGSSDQTAAVCDGIDTRIRVITIANGGPANARNTGIEAATGQLVAFCDADDIWHAGKLAKQRQCFQDNAQLGLCCTDYQVVDPQDNILTASGVADRGLPTTHTLSSMLEANPVMTSSAVVSRAAMIEIGGFPDTFDETLNLHLAGEDFEAWIAIAEHHPIAMVPEVLVSYRQMPGGMYLRNINSRRASKVLLNRRVALIKNVAKRNANKISPAQTKKAVSEIYFRSAYRHRLEADFLTSGIHNFQSLIHGPTRIKAYIELGLLPVRTVIHHAKRIFKGQ